MLDREGRILMSGMRPQRVHCPFHQVRRTHREGTIYDIGNKTSPDIQSLGTLILDFSTFKNVRNKFLLFISHLIYEIYYSSLNRPRQQEMILETSEHPRRDYGSSKGEMSRGEHVSLLRASLTAKSGPPASEETALLQTYEPRMSHGSWGSAF